MASTRRCHCLYLTLCVSRIRNIREPIYGDSCAEKVLTSSVRDIDLCVEGIAVTKAEACEAIASYPREAHPSSTGSRVGSRVGRDILIVIAVFVFTDQIENSDNGDLMPAGGNRDRQ